MAGLAVNRVLRMLEVNSLALRNYSADSMNSSIGHEEDLNPHLA
jgi:hypothetical protein